MAVHGLFCLQTVPCFFCNQTNQKKQNFLFSRAIVYQLAADCRCDKISNICPSVTGTPGFGRKRLHNKSCAVSLGWLYQKSTPSSRGVTFFVRVVVLLLAKKVFPDILHITRRRRFSKTLFERIEAISNFPLFQLIQHEALRCHNDD